MQIARFQQKTSSSLRSAYTTAQLQSQPIARQVRNERFIAETSVAGQANANQAKIRATQTIFGAVAGVANTFAVKLEDAEYRAQAAKAVNQYQKDVGQLRAGQIGQPLLSKDEAGKRVIVSDEFAEQYEEGSLVAAESAYDNGLTNERAKAYFEEYRGKVDNKHRKDINEFNTRTRIDVMTRDSIEALDTAVTKGQIHSIVNGMVNTQLLEAQKAPGLIKTKMQGLNFRNLQADISIIGNNSANVNMSDDAFYGRLEQAHNAATAMYMDKDQNINLQQYNAVTGMIKRTESIRDNVIEHVRELNVYSSLVEHYSQSVKTGVDSSALSRNIMNSPAAIEKVLQEQGPDKGADTLKMHRENANGGDPDIFDQQRANGLLSDYIDTGSNDTYNELAAYVRDNGSSLGTFGIKMRRDMTTARNNEASSRYQEAGIITKGILARHRTEQDFLGDTVGLDISEWNEWNTTFKLVLKAEGQPLADGTMPPQTDLTKMFLNTKLTSINVPGYAGESLLEVDESTARNYIAEKALAYQDDFDSLVDVPTSDGLKTNIIEWEAAETQNLDVIMQFKRLLKTQSVVEMLEPSVRDGLGIKTVIRNGVVSYE